MPTPPPLSKIVYLRTITRYVWCVIWFLYHWDILSFSSQYGGCWWPGAYLLCFAGFRYLPTLHISPDYNVHGANMGPTWILSTPDGPHVGPMNFAIRVLQRNFDDIGANIVPVSKEWVWVIKPCVWSMGYIINGHSDMAYTGKKHRPVALQRAPILSTSHSLHSWFD